MSPAQPAKKSIRASMLLAFLGATSLLIVAAVVGLIKLVELQSEFHQLVEVQVRAMATARAWAGLSEANIQRRIVAMVSPDKAFVKAFTATQAETSKQIEQLRKELAELETSPESKQIAAQIAQSRSRYLEVREQLDKRAAAGESVSSQVTQELMPLMADYLGTVRRYADHMQTEMEQANERAAHMAHTIRMLQIGLLVAGLAVAVGVALRMTHAITIPLIQAQQHAGRIAAGDLTQRIEVNRQDELGQLQQALQAMQTSLASTIGQVRQAAQQVESASSEISAGSHDLSSRTEMAAAGIEQTGAATQQLTETVRVNAEAAEQASVLARTASDVAVEGDAMVREVVQSMDEIQKASGRISDIIAVIDGIAFQTNILALNAAVEAARAGDHGRGFAVVAGEVRTLAQRSATAAREIRGLIVASTEQVQHGGELVQRTGQTIGNMVQSIQKVTAVVAAISTSSSSQSHTLQEVDNAIRQFDQMTQQNAALVEQSAAAAESLMHQSTQLVGAVETFRLP